MNNIVNRALAAKKKLFTLFLALMVCTTFTNAEIIERVQIGDLYYNLDTENKIAEVTYSPQYEDLETTTADIPSSVEYNLVTYSVTSIGYEAFYGCDGLTSIICKAVDLPTLGDDAFKYVPKNIPLYVPDGKESAYNDAYQWKEFDVKPISAIPTGIEQAKSQEPIANSQKLIKNGQILILRGDKTYNVMGAEVR